MNAPILTPMLALILWTFVIWVWMYATRIPAMNAARIDPQQAACLVSPVLDEDEAASFIDGERAKIILVKEPFRLRPTSAQFDRTQVVQ